MPDSELSQTEQDALDAKRWRAVCQRHAVGLVHRFVAGAGYNSRLAPEQLNAWADRAIAEIEQDESMTPAERAAERADRIARLERDLLSSGVLSA